MKRVSILCLAAVAVFLSFPAFGSDKNPVPPPPLTVVSLNLAVPSIAPMPETKTEQTRGGVSITVETDMYKAEAGLEATEAQFNPGFKETFKMNCQLPENFLIRTYFPKAEIKPEYLVLHLHINNLLPHVFRGAGAMVQFSIAGKTIHVDPNGYGDFLNLIVPPRASQDVDIVGPRISDIPARANIGVYISDVVTQMDEAGNIKAKENFEWYYSWQTQSTTKDVTVPAPQKHCAGR